MKIKSNIKELIQQFDTTKKEIDTGLVNMVKGFTYAITVEAIEQTPYGDPIRYAELYDLESRLIAVPDVGAGFAKGGWILSAGEPYYEAFNIKADGPSANNVKADARNNLNYYALGDTVYITNAVPYVVRPGFTLLTFGALNQGYSDDAPDGIMQPTVDTIMSVFRMNLKNYYDKGVAGA